MSSGCHFYTKNYKDGVSSHLDLRELYYLSPLPGFRGDGRIFFHGAASTTWIAYEEAVADATWHITVGGRTAARAPTAIVTSYSPRLRRGLKCDERTTPTTSVLGTKMARPEEAYD